MLSWLKRYVLSVLALWAYSFQTFSALEVLGAAKMNQIEVNIRDHAHGTASVSALTGAQGASLVFVSEQSASNSASLSFTGLTEGITDIFEFSNILLQNNAQFLLCRVSTDNGSSYKSGANDYAYANWAGDTGTGFAALSDDTAAQMLICGNSISNSNPFSGTLKISGISGTGGPKQFNWEFSFISGTGTQSKIIGGGTYIAAATAINALMFAASTGNIVSGKIRRYRLRDA